MFSGLFSHDVHHPQKGEFLSEAFLDASSARDALPERYRIHFDELRSDILAFCHEFEIPREALRDIQTFGDCLRHLKIPPKRMEEAVLLFERIHYLVRL